jgi:hypothetical protein
MPSSGRAKTTGLMLHDYLYTYMMIHGLTQVTWERVEVAKIQHP